MALSETERILLEYRLLRSGIPYHVHTNGMLCTSPYCQSLFDDAPRPGPQETQEDAEKRYNQGEQEPR
jgi:hypothetical protein